MGEEKKDYYYIDKNSFLDNPKKNNGRSPKRNNKCLSRKENKWCSIDHELCNQALMINDCKDCDCKDNCEYKTGMFDSGQKIVLSKIVFNGCVEALEKINQLCKNIFVIGPTYKNKDTGQPLDSQIICSGSIKKHETVKDAVVREISEELGIQINSDKLEFICTKVDGKHNVSTFVYNICHGILDTNIYEKNNIVADKINDTNDKIQVIIYGSIDQLYNIYNTSVNITDKHIIGSCIISFADALAHVKNMEHVLKHTL